MKLSFSLPPKSSTSSSKPSIAFNHVEGDSANTKHLYVTEFDSSKTLDPQNKTHVVIPPQENSFRPENFRPEKRMRNIHLPDDPSAPGANMQFEVEDLAAAAAASESGISYGLNLRSANENGLDGSVRTSVESIALEKFREDMKNLPEDRGLDEFKDVPIEGFGHALLSGYGWTEGKGIGRNAKEDVKVVQYVRRADREGLGFVPSVHDKKKRKGDNHSGKVQAPVLVAPVGSDGRSRHVVGIDEKLVPREEKGIFVGKIVRVISGRHAGLKGKVKNELDNSKVVLKLLKSEEEVTVGMDQVAELGSVEEESGLRKLQELRIKDTDSSSRIHRGKRDDVVREVRKNDREEERRRKESHGDEKKERKKDRSNREGMQRNNRMPISWLRSHIRVRIVSKDFKGGKLYLKKGEVMDVVGPTTCDITVDESRELIQGVDQEILETALPKRGGPVIVLSGKHKGVFGSLMERDMEKEIGVVRDADSHELLTARLEQIAEYMGDPSDIGY